ncbi:uncharacterized protein LOC132198102 isoform X2 [Neocloeon triangulifer]|uniref:uncharacterized protein LOC132198102 isoform X2 n=1 Tax=Neocloeon triangulifer TaxID=2078957 RepID=UPI00286FA3FC|nr:uncharacterized protein LOC132198102 isoform X2 [Neocloeon triangulifer]
MQVLPSALLLCALCRFLARAAQPPLASEEPDAAAGERASKFLDHVVTKEQAAQAASKFDVSKLGVSDEVGCGKCSLQERMYCVSDAVLSDHCCCDKHLEPMPFVPHRCYVNLPPAAPCAPIAGNCAQYSRIYDCCCKHILQQRWHNKLVSGAHVPRGGLVALLATLAMLLFRW